MKIVFCGTPNISINVIKALQNLKLEIVGVISQPDKPVGRKKIVTPTPVKEYCKKFNFKIFQPNKIIEIEEELKKLKPDFLITCAYGQIIPEKILNIFKKCINVHASLLPKYRGGSPIQFSIMNGDKKTGITLMEMVKKMDAGDMFASKEIEISQKDNLESLTNKLSLLAKELLEEKLIDILNNNLLPIKQDESKVTFAYNFKSEDEEINWNNPSENIYNFIRSLDPRPVAFTNIIENSTRVKIKKTRLLEKNDIFPINLKVNFPGEVVFIDKEGIVVQTIDGFIKILELQLAGKNMVNAGTFASNNSYIKIGTLFGKIK